MYEYKPHFHEFDLLVTGSQSKMGQAPSKLTARQVSIVVSMSAV